MKFTIKRNLFVLLLLVPALFSCTEDEKDKVVISDKAVITKFYLYSDSNKDMDDYVFSIDNEKKLIFNADSMPFGTKVDSLIPMITPKFYKVYVNDTIDLYALDSAYFNFNNDIRLTVVAADKKTSATYDVDVNVHQVDPDTFVWRGLKSQVFSGVSSSERAVWSNERLVYFANVDGSLVINRSADGISWETVSPKGLTLDMSNIDLRHVVSSSDYIYIAQGNDVYSSTDAVNWTKLTTTGDPIKFLLCYFNGRLTAVSESMHFVSLNGSSWMDLGELPYDFPVKGGAVCVDASPSGKYRIYVVGGIDSKGNYLSSVWSTENGSYWSNMVPGKAQFTPRAYAAVVQYANGLMLWGGQSAEGKVVDDAQMYSKDYGMNWTSPIKKSVIDNMYRPRYDLSAITTPAGYIYLVGGRAVADKSISDVWMGYQYASLDGFKR